MSHRKLLTRAAAAILGLAYVDAKYCLSHDLHALKSLIKGKRNLAAREASGRLNCFYYLEEGAKARPDTTFLVYQDQEWTNKEAYNLTLRYANYFLSLGIQPKQMVALDFTNKPAFVFSILGLWTIGATPAMINFNLQEAALLHCVKVCEAKIMIVDKEVYANAATITKDLQAAGVRVVCHDDRSWREELPSGIEVMTDLAISQQPTTRPSDALRGNVKGTTACALIYTSGSTGMPKAAVIPWSKFNASSVSSSSLIDIRSTDRYYSCMPLYHGTACILGFGSCLVTGATFILGHKFSNKTFWPEVRQSRATVIQYVGEVCRYLMAVPPSPLDKQHNVRMAYGNGMRPDVWEKFRTRFGIQIISEFYASTEGVGGSFNHNSGPFGAGAVGRSGGLIRAIAVTHATIKVDPDTEVEQRTPDGLCVLCAPGEPGEMLYPLDATAADATKAFTGYYGNKKASESKLIRNVRTKGDLFIRMGDMMSQDADGFLYFHDRMGDTFRWKGENVSTTEVSEAIGAFPGITEANVYGVQLPNHDGRAGCVAVVLDSSVPLNLDSLASHLAKSLPKYAVPQFVRFVETMEVTGNHKHSKVGLRKQGVDPTHTKQDAIYWLKDGKYAKFSDSEWRSIVGGSARL